MAEGKEGFGMILNGIIISQAKYQHLARILPQDDLHALYHTQGKSDREIAEQHGLTPRWVSKLRKMYDIKTDPRYGLRRNPLRTESLSQGQTDFLYGTLLGDSCIAQQRSGNAYWLCRHSRRQERYLLSKSKIMEPFTAKVSYGWRPFEKGGPEFPHVDARSFSLPQFKALRDELYPGGKKTVTSSWLEKLTPYGFAFWFLDDGSMTGHSFEITSYDPYFRRKSDAEMLFRDVLGLSVHITRKKEEREGRIHVLKESRDRAWEYIRDQVTEDMWHKIPPRYKGI